jgi:hypothetical protein
MLAKYQEVANEGRLKTLNNRLDSLTGVEGFGNMLATKGETVC